jgi:hypothetical protein
MRETTEEGRQRTEMLEQETDRETVRNWEEKDKRVLGEKSGKWPFVGQK